MKVALIITTYNRPDLLKRCISSVQNIERGDYELVVTIIDDASTDENTHKIIEDSGFRYILHSVNKGIKHRLFTSFESAFKNEFDLAINLDGDAIVKYNFITRLIDLKKRFPDRIISGFNCNHPKNPVLFDGPDYVERKHANGINYCLDKSQYEKIVRPALLSPTGNWDFSSTHNKNFIISKPSVVQHLGTDCSTLGHTAGDVACDF